MPIVCQKCGRYFSTPKRLRIHVKKMHADIAEITLLEHGFLPEKTKFGKAFRGRNRVIVS